MSIETGGSGFGTYSQVVEEVSLRHASAIVGDTDCLSLTVMLKLWLEVLFFFRGKLVVPDPATVPKLLMRSAFVVLLQVSILEIAPASES